jgi:hypothetical protein
MVLCASCVRKGSNYFGNALTPPPMSAFRASGKCQSGGLAMGHNRYFGDIGPGQYGRL